MSVYVRIESGSELQFAGLCDGGLTIRYPDDGGPPELTLRLWDNGAKVLDRYTKIEGGEHVTLDLQRR